MAATYEPIATTTLGSANANITFSSISSAYSDIRVVFTGTWTATGGLRTTINSVTSGGLYSYTQLQGDGSTAYSFRVTNDNGYDCASSSSTTIPTMVTMDFFSYAGSTYKTGLVTISEDQNGAGVVQRDVLLFRSTSAISSINLAAIGTTFKTGTTATLFGIKAA